MSTPKPLLWCIGLGSGAYSLRTVFWVDAALLPLLLAALGLQRGL